MPNTTRSEKMLGMYSILLGLIMALYSGFVLIIYISINKSGLIRYRIMGIERRQIYNCLTRRYFLLIMLISVFISISKFHLRQNIYYLVFCIRV